MSAHVEVMDVDADDVKGIDYGLPWVEKYRPNDLSELIAHEEIINICMSINVVVLSSLFIYNAIVLIYIIFFSKQTHREQQAAPSFILWPSRHRKNVDHQSVCEENVWRSL